VEATPVDDSRIAIVGMSVRVPGARTLDQYWSNLAGGVESITDLTVSDLIAAGVPDSLLQNPDYVRRAAQLDGVEWFDAGFFGFNSKEAAVMDPQHRLFLECGWHTLEDAGCDPYTYDGSIGVFGGSGYNASMPYHLLGNAELLESMGFFLMRHTGNDKDFLTTRLSYCLNLRGPSVNVQTACSTSLVAVHLGAQSLLNGECDIALAGGVSIGFPLHHGYLYRPSEILSRDGHCRAFDARSSGTVFGSGAAIVALKRLGDAIEDGDDIRAVLLSTAVNNDGAGKAGYLAPSVDGQAEAIGEALEVAEIDVETVGYVEAHGTGTQIGDPIEISALTLAYGAKTDRLQFCGIGSVKTNIGHLDTAAGTVSLIKTVLALQNRKMPPSLNFTDPNPAIDFENSPFYVNDRLKDWDGAGHPLRAGVSSLGVGGTNAHVILEEAPASAASRPSTRLPSLILLTAKSAGSLEAMRDNMVDFLDSSDLEGDGLKCPDVSIADVAYTSQTARSRLPLGSAIIAGSRHEAIAALDAEDHPAKIVLGEPLAGTDAVFMFTGQGSQFVGMGSGLYEHELVYKQAFDECCAIADRFLGQPLADLVLGESSPERKDLLVRTSIAQPALFALEYSLARLWMSWGVTPSALIGHSIGEYVGACLASVFSLDQAMRLVVERGRLMQSAPPGRMLAVMLSEAEVATHLDDTFDIAALNGPSTVVVSGTEEDIDRLKSHFDRRKVGCAKVRTSHAFHSRSMDGILDDFKVAVASAQPQVNRIPLISNTSGTWITEAEVTSPEYWARHLRGTVRFTEGISTLAAASDRVFLEIGPSPTLTQFASQVEDIGSTHRLIPSLRGPESDRGDQEAMLASLAQLWMAGVEPDWEAFHGGEERKKVSLPPYPFSRQRYWFDPPGKTISAATANTPGSEEWTYAPIWEPCASSQTEYSATLRLIVADASIIERLPVALDDVRTVYAVFGESFVQGDVVTVRKGIGADIERLHGAVSQNAVSTELIYISPVGGASPIDVFTEYLELVKTAGSLRGVHLKVVVTGLVPPDALPGPQESKDGSMEPHYALACGPVFCATAELGVKAVLIDTNVEAIVEASTFETLCRIDFAEPMYAVRGSTAYRRAYARQPVTTSAALDLRDKSILITGGVEGLGLHAANFCAKAGAKLVLLGRTELPPESEWSTWIAKHAGDSITRRIESIERLRKLSASVEYRSVDVTDYELLATTIGEIGRIDGVIHAAGCVDDAPMLNKTMNSARSVLAPKVIGTENLLRCLRSASLDLFVGYSSMSSLVGVPGQSDYVSANAFLDAALAQLSDQTDTRALAINWSAWSQIGMTQRMAKPEPSIAAQITHPMVGSQKLTNEPETVFATEFCTATDWLVDGHRAVSGQSILPGAGLLEMVRAAYSPLARYQTTELRDVMVLSPFVLTDDKPREARIQFSPWSRGDQFSIISQADADSPDTWYTHVQGRVQILPRGERARHSLDELRKRCRKQIRNHTNEQVSFLRFGERWSCIESLRVAKTEALLEIKLPDRFSSDLDEYWCHPAMLDAATAGVLRLIPNYQPERHFYVPIAYSRVVFFAAMPQRWFSHIRYRSADSIPGEVVVFDALIMDEHGRELARVDELMLKCLDSIGVIANAKPPVTTRTQPVEVVGELEGSPLLKERLASSGISPDKGAKVLEGLLSSFEGRQAIVSPTNVDELLLRMVETQSGARDKSAAVQDRIDLRAIEDALQAHEEVDKAAALATVDRFGKLRVSAFVERAASSKATMSELRRFGRRRLSEELVPSVILDIEKIPLLASGEVDRAQLPDPLSGDDDVVDPTTDTERALAEVWQDVLGVKEISATDNFFDLGGHSLLAVRAIATIEKQTGVRIEDVIILTYTLEQTAAELDRRRAQPKEERSGFSQMVRSLVGSK
jgi:acyl transferase domain-containing protein/NAD(P)-dependent dehydrogenase (short-subunit alcohol dehydrogenase family)/acyl carrier protein